MLKSAVDRIAVVVYDKHNKPRERFMFDVSHFPDVPIADVDTPLERTGDNSEKMPVLPVIDMEEHFRATMSKLANCGSVLKPLPERCTFTVAIELKGEGKAPLGHPQPWMPVQPKSTPETESAFAGTTTPIRTIAAGDMVFESWIEEAAD